MAMGKLSYCETGVKGIETRPETLWIRNRDSDQTSSSVDKKSIPLPLGVMDPAQSWG